MKEYSVSFGLLGNDDDAIRLGWAYSERSFYDLLISHTVKEEREVIGGNSVCEFCSSIHAVKMDFNGVSITHCSKSECIYRAMAAFERAEDKNGV